MSQESRASDEREPPNGSEQESLVAQIRREITAAGAISEQSYHTFLCRLDQLPDEEVRQVIELTGHLSLHPRWP